MAPPLIRARDWPSAGPVEDRIAPGNPQDIPNGPGYLRRGRAMPMPISGTPVATVFDESDWPKFNGTLVFELVATTSTLILAQPTNLRNGLILRNGSTDVTGPNIFINLGGGSASTRSIIRIVAGNHVLFDRRVPQDEIYAFADGAGAILLCARAQTPGTPPL